MPVSKKFKYPASEIEDYLARFAEAVAGKRRLVRSAMPSVLGFQSWMATASPVDTWPFSIQRNGRPMDMCAAIIAGKLTGKAEELTLRAFCERVADASAKAFHLAEARELDRVARKGKDVRNAHRTA